MKIKNIEESMKMANRFIKDAQLALERINEYGGYIYGCKETGQLRRTSMDLTRSLSKLRKP